MYDLRIAVWKGGSVITKMAPLPSSRSCSCSSAYRSTGSRGDTRCELKIIGLRKTVSASSCLVNDQKGSVDPASAKMDRVFGARIRRQISVRIAAGEKRRVGQIVGIVALLHLRYSIINPGK